MLLLFGHNIIIVVVVVVVFVFIIIVDNVKVNKFLLSVSPSEFQAAGVPGRPEHPLLQRRHPARGRRVAGGRTASLPGHKSVAFET